MCACNVCGSEQHTKKYKIINKKTKTLRLCPEHKRYYRCNLCFSNENLGERRILPERGEYKKKRFVLLCEKHLMEHKQYEINKILSEEKALIKLLKTPKKMRD